MSKKKNTIKLIQKLLKPHIYLLLLSMLFSVVTVVFTLYAPILIGDAVDYGVS